MLTHNDVTVPNARECFRAASDLPVQLWGFKDVGLSTFEMKALVADFRDAGKTPVLEVVSFNEAQTLEAASLAISCGVEYFTGGLFSPAVMEQVKGAGMKYFPFCGDVGGHPIQLRGAVDELVAAAEHLCDLGVDGVDLVAYRYGEGDPATLARAVTKSVGVERVIIAGSINSLARLERMREVQPFGYTMGGALFEGVFDQGGSFADNLRVVVDASNGNLGALA